jgi:Leucine-rich repeat (LRR) protein
LSLNETKVQQIPNHISEKLIYLSWWGCELSDISDLQFGKQLEYLNVAKNNLSSLPESLKEVDELQYLNISHNKFVDAHSINYFAETRILLLKGNHF